ncbi:YeiH family protein [Paenibacillus sp. CMAA1364]
MDMNEIREKRIGFLQGLLITFIIAIVAKYLALLPFLSIMGQLVIAIIIGIAYRAFIGVPKNAGVGISFSSKKLLRLGIIFLGMRLNLMDIVHAGPKVLIIAIINIAFTLVVVYALARWLKVDKNLGILTACGTAICGAAAVVAISPQLKASDDETAVAAANVAILGTIFTLAYTVLYPFLNLSPAGYGIFAGGTLHEIAHVIAAAAPGGQEAVDLAVIVKLTRVGMLVPIAICIGIWTRRQENRISNTVASKMSWREIPIPWFIVGFLLMSGVNTLDVIPKVLTGQIITLAYLLIAMAMAGLGLGVEIATFRRLGMKSIVAGGLGSILLSVLGYVLVIALGLR